MIVRIIALSSIACLSMTLINASDNRTPQEKISLQELSTAVQYSASFTAAGAVPVTAATVLLGDRTHGICNIEKTTASTIALGVLASAGALISLEVFFRKPGNVNSTDAAKIYLKRAGIVSAGLATAYAASKLTNDTIAPSTFVASFFTGVSIAVAATYLSCVSR